MPQMDGYQLCRLIKGNDLTKAVPVVMLSGKDGFFDKMRGRMVGASEYLTKPFEPHLLLQTVDKHCALREQAAG
jgi:twitching motility two-component system response regulator PilG